MPVFTWCIIFLKVKDESLSIVLKEFPLYFTDYLLLSTFILLLIF